MTPKSWTKNFWGFVMKYSLEDRLKIVKSYRKGESRESLKSNYGVRKIGLFAWCAEAHEGFIIFPVFRVPILLPYPETSTILDQQNKQREHYYQSVNT